MDYEADAADLNNEPAADNDDDAEPANSRTETPDDEPILPNSFITRGILLALVFAYFIRHHLTKAAKADFLFLLNLVVPGCVPKTMYYFDKKFNASNGSLPMEKHFFCPTCAEYIGTNDADLTCIYCKEKYDVKVLKSKNSYFIVSPLKPQLKKMLENSNLYECIQKTKSKNFDGKSEIPSGDLYRTGKLRRFFRQCFSNFTMSFNTDGAAVFRASCAAIWPLFLTFNEIDFSLKSKFLILHSLYFGDKKPKMSTFLKPFIDEAIALYNEGLEFIHNGLTLTSHVAFPICIADAPYRCSICNCHQWNGEFGC